MKIARVLGAALVALALPASAQYMNTMNGRQFSNMHAANADFLMSQMIQQGQWNIMRMSMDQAIEKQRRAQGLAPAPAQGRAPAPKAAPAKVAYKYPLTATDFKPAGARNVPQQLSAAVGNAADRRQFEAACRDILATIEKTPGFRKNNLAAAMTVLLGVSLQVVKQIEIPDAESQEFMRGLNDQLAPLSAFSGMTAEKRTQVYDTMVIVGGLIAGIAQNAAETQNREMAALAQQMAKDALAQFGVKS